MHRQFESGGVIRCNPASDMGYIVVRKCLRQEVRALQNLTSLLRLALVAFVGIIVNGAFAQSLTQLPDSVVPALSQAQLIGAPPASQTVYFTVSLKPRFPAELQAFADDVNNPRSPNYRDWLTPAQVGQQFGASPTTVSSIVSYLK